MNRRQRAAYRLWHGSILLARRIGNRTADWIAKGPGKPQRIARLLIVLLGAYVIARMIRAVPGVLWLIVPVWCWRAVRSVQAPAEEQLSTAPDAATGQAWRAFVEGAIKGRQGVHLRDLLDALHQNGHHPDWEVADVRRVCERAGIPVRARVRVRGLGVTVGVHRDDLTAPSSPSPAPTRQEGAEPELHAV